MHTYKAKQTAGDYALALWSSKTWQSALTVKLTDLKLYSRGELICGDGCAHMSRATCVNTNLCIAVSANSILDVCIPASGLE